MDKKKLIALATVATLAAGGILVSCNTNEPVDNSISEITESQTESKKESTEQTESTQTTTTTQATITSIRAVSNNGTALEIKNGTQTSVKVTIKDQNGNTLTDISNMTVSPATSGVVSITTNKDGTITVRALKEGTVKVTFNYNNGEKTLTSALNFTVTDKTDKISAPAPTSTISKEEKQKAETPTPTTPTISKEEMQKAETPAPAKTESNVSQTPVQVQIEESKKQEAVLTGIALSSTSMALNKGYQGTFSITAYQSGVGDLNCNYSVSTSDNNVASVSFSENVVTVKAKNGGTCKVTVSVRDKNGVVKSASCNVTVKVQEVSQPTQQSSQPVQQSSTPSQQSSTPSQQSSTPSQTSVPNSNPDFFLGDSLEWIKALHDRGIPAGEEVKPYVEKHCRKIGSCNGQGIYELDASAQKEFMNALNKYRRSYGWEEAHWMQDKTTQDVKAFYEKLQRDWELVADTPEEAIAIYESAYGSFFDSNGNYSAEFATKWTEKGHSSYVKELSEMIKNNDFAHHGCSHVIWQSKGYDNYDLANYIEDIRQTSPSHWEILMKQNRTEIYVAFTIDDSWGIRMMTC